ncbi:uncharacterized protein LOC116308163 [Actinia tenebrosa]|uniref:Uncharacterized protein LOC116308163 n=1 Tax=Actinia tenebrosa TaxID=6105 RepID=A0A6P8J423_ACTTE|nr:uncharacterized protein LOC116308163 [Actinia tenebrosa]
MSEEGQDVLVLASHDINDSTSIASCGQTETTTTNVLNKLLAGTNSSGTSAPNTYILYIPGFRKIEPKPGLKLRRDEVVEEKEASIKESKQISSGRFLGINATKRGVKTCPICLNKIGYRAKQCKHCSPSKLRNPRKSRLQTIKPLIGKQNESTETEMVDMVTRQPHPVVCTAVQGSQQRLEEPKVTHDEPCASLGEEQSGLRGPPIVSQSEQIMTSENQHVSEITMIAQGEQLVTSGEQQGSKALTPQGDQQGLEGILHQGQNQDESLELDKPQGTQYEHVGQLTEHGQQNRVVDEVVISNVTEVGTCRGDRIDKTNQEVVVTSESHDDMVSQVFISSKLTQNNPSAIPSGRISLQDLICGLLAQNQATLSGANPGELKENPISSTGTTTIAVQTDSANQNTMNKSLGEQGTVELEDNREKKSIPENSFDANSVALFLGEMAQRNGKKRRISSTSKATDDQTKLVTLSSGAMQKWNVLNSSDAKGAKFRKIQPKDMANVQEDVVVCEEEKEEAGESQCRIMNGNATRRGVMLCSKCNKMIGCRSKICKHCKNQVTENPPRETNPRVIKQAVQLCLPKELNIQMFSVRKCKTGPELRCFVQFEDKHDSTTNKSKCCSSKYTCDYPLCITAKELGNKASDYICEHAKICCVSANVAKAKIPKLNLEKLSEMPLGNDMKDMVQALYQQCSDKNIPLVQYVSRKTLVVVDHLHSDLGNPLGSDIISFAHLRFEKVKGQGCFQRQVFCSGQSCMAWNFISNDSPASLMKSCSCVHYAVALWAIASDSTLLKDLREYLDAFVLQTKIETFKT